MVAREGPAGEAAAGQRLGRCRSHRGGGSTLRGPEEGTGTGTGRDAGVGWPRPWVGEHRVSHGPQEDMEQGGMGKIWVKGLRGTNLKL